MRPDEILLDEVLTQYDLKFAEFQVGTIGSGYIHQTYRLSGDKDFILQRVNKDVFRKPDIIANNLRLAAEYLKQHYPDYLFLTAIKTKDGREMAWDAQHYPWRLFPYFDNTYTIDKVETAEQAFSAAAEFARLVKNLDGIDLNGFNPTIERFHDLQWRYHQFNDSLKKPVADRFIIAKDIIKAAERYEYLVKEYNALIATGILKLRITHNDTKINNILFDNTTGKALCAIDLDTLMPGYFIYDVGDMIRTFVSPVDEEERDLDKVIVRKDIYEAIINGYVAEMSEQLAAAEKNAIAFSGQMMTYIMALRMLTDYLNGDIYYNIKYADQNLVRAKNQFRLLDLLTDFRKETS
jgi:Ser/Thr protein kinase RdoA (MazF antagonist)